MVEKMWQPAWYQQLMWSPARSIAEINSSMIPRGAGLYAFTRSRDTLTLLYQLGRSNVDFRRRQRENANQINIT